MKKKCYKVEYDMCSGIGENLPELINMICDGNGHFPEAKVGDIITITILEMTQEELEALPEYEG